MAVGFLVRSGFFIATEVAVFAVQSAVQSALFLTVAASSFLYRAAKQNTRKSHHKKKIEKSRRASI